MQIRKFVEESRKYMSHLSDDEFEERLPAAIALYMFYEIADAIKEAFEWLKNLVLWQR